MDMNKSRISRLKGFLRKIGEKLRILKPIPKKEFKLIEFKVNIGFYQWRTTYTTTRKMLVHENPKDYFSEILREAETWVYEQESWILAGQRRSSLMITEIGYEEI